MNQRLAFPDICKFLAIFLVTYAHSAHRISGEILTANYLGGTTLDIAFNMPLFMIISGWFINLTKLRTTPIFEFIISKFKRLMLPALTWGLIYCIIAPRYPGIFLFHFYWYLTALFVSLCIIYICAKLIQHDNICIAVSIMLVLLCPLSQYSHINFMFPFLWVGYGLHKLFKTKHITPVAFVSLFIGIGLSFFWSPIYTIYLSPLKTQEFSFPMVHAYIYRFSIGTTLSIPIIALIHQYEYLRPIQRIAQYGIYSLIIYTASDTLNFLAGRVFNKLGFHTNEPFLLDFLAFTQTCLIVVISIFIYRICQKNKITKLLFLGEG